MYKEPKDIKSLNWFEGYWDENYNKIGLFCAAIRFGPTIVLNDKRQNVDSEVAKTKTEAKINLIRRYKSEIKTLEAKISAVDNLEEY